MNIFQATALGTGGIMYNNGNIISGPQDSLVNLLMPNKPEDLDKVCTNFTIIAIVFLYKYNIIYLRV